MIAEGKGGIAELRNIPSFIEKESAMRKENVFHLVMMEVKKISGLNQTEFAARLGMPQPNVSRIEHSEIVTFNTFSEYLAACGFGFTINLWPAIGGKREKNIVCWILFTRTAPLMLPMYVFYVNPAQK